MHIHGPDHGGEKDQKLHVRVRLVAGVEEIDPGIRGDSPVVVLARAVDPGKGFFVHETDEAVMACHRAEDVHCQHLMIGGDVGVLVDRGNLILTRGDFVMSRGDGNSQLIQTLLRLGHEGENAFGD